MQVSSTALFISIDRATTVINTILRTEMSVALDFSDMFRQQSVGASASLSKRRDNETFNASDLTRAFQFESVNADENAPPVNLSSSSRDDLRSWVRTSLSALNISGFKDEDISDAALPMLQKLINDVSACTHKLSSYASTHIVPLLFIFKYSASTGSSSSSSSPRTARGCAGAPRPGRRPAAP
jgi:hypothetical protein